MQVYTYIWNLGPRGVDTILGYCWAKNNKFILINLFRPEFIIVIFIYYKPRIAVAILDL